MGFLDFLFDKEKAEARKLGKMQKAVTNMYVQPAERQFTLQQLRDIGTPDAIRVMLLRFNESAPNSTVDLEEKEYVYDILVDMCRHDPRVIQIVADHIKKSEAKINWPIKVLQDIYDFEQMADFLCDILRGQETEYQRDPEKKQEVILRAAEFKNQALATEVERFVEDANETVRFHAVETALIQGFDSSKACLFRALAEEDSLRIVQKISAGVCDREDWIVPEDAREAVANALPDEYGIHENGYIFRKRH